MDLEISQWLLPWEFSPTLVLMFVISACLFVRGTFVHKVGRIRQSLFWIGFVMLYLSLHTHLDYYAERVFFVHRLQHLVLHHLGPLMIMASYPGQVMRAGLPMWARVVLRDFRLTAFGRFLEGLMTNRIFIPFMFVFLVIIWLFPIIQFYSMLDWRLYRLMNWSVVFSGFLYWNLILDRRPSMAAPVTAQSVLGRFWQRYFVAGSPAVMTPFGRIISPIFTMAPQMVAGALIAFSSVDLYPLFDVCGRALPISALQDQSIGGLTMWVPAAIVETFGIVVAVMNWMRLSASGRLHRSNAMLTATLANAPKA